MNRNCIYFMSALLLLASCTSELVRDAEEVVDASASKICNTAADAEDNVLIVKFSEDAVEAVEQAAAGFAATKSPMTRSGIESIDEIISETGVTGLERVFPSGANEAETKAAGLHRWYLVHFADGEDITAAAEMFASVSEISLVQFSAKLKNASDGNVMPLSKSAESTRAMVTSDFNDPELCWQWHYINNADLAIADDAVAGADIDVAEAWKLTGGDSRIIVAVLDEGIKYTHPDLSANMWTNSGEIEGDGIDNDGNGYVDDIHGYNFVNSGAITWDVTTDSQNSDTGHATHVAGTVAAVNNNGIGVAGVAGGTGNGDGVRLMSCQIFSGGISASDYNASRAMKYAADNGACILQCSYGYTSTQITSDRSFESQAPLVVEALEYFFSKSNCEALDGGLAFYAAGNESESISNYPGAYRKCISVTATGPDMLPAYYTCYGYGCNIAAPGGEMTGFSGGELAGILSTTCTEWNSGEEYGYMQGTSMACPHVSGVAALGLSYALKKGKHFTRDEFTSMILTSVNDIESRLEGTKKTGATIQLEDYSGGRMGSGQIDAYRLLMQVEGTPCIVVSTGKLELVTLTSLFGGSAESLTYTGVEYDESDVERLGMEAVPQMYNGKLMLKCSKPGVARLTVKAIAGGDRAATNGIIGGTEVSREFAVIARESVTSNGGWL